MAQNYLAVEDVASLLNITNAEVIAATTQGHLRGFKDGASWKFRKEDVDKYANDIVDAYSTDTYVQRFYAGESVWIRVRGDGDTDLDLYVYDENGNLIDSDTDTDDKCLCIFTPKWTGRFTIKVKNLGNVYNRYYIRFLQ